MDRIIPSKMKVFSPPRNVVLDFLLKYQLKIEFGAIFGIINGQFVSIHGFGNTNLIIFTLRDDQARDQIKKIINDQKIKNVAIKFNQLEIQLKQSSTDKKLNTKAEEALLFWSNELNKIQNWDDFNQNNDFVLINEISAPKDDKYFAEYERQLKKYFLENKENNFEAMTISLVKSFPLNFLLSSLLGVFFYLIHSIFFPLNFIMGGTIFFKSFKKNIERLGKTSWLFLFVGLVLSSFASLVISYFFSYYLKYSSLNFQRALDYMLNTINVSTTIKTFVILIAFLFSASRQRLIGEEVRIQDGWKLNDSDISNARKSIRKAQKIAFSIIALVVIFFIVALICTY